MGNTIQCIAINSVYTCIYRIVYDYLKIQTFLQLSLTKTLLYHISWTNPIYFDLPAYSGCGSKCCMCKL